MNVPGLYFLAPPMRNYDPLVRKLLREGKYQDAHLKVQQFLSEESSKYLTLLGWMHTTGKGVTANQELAKSYFNQAANLNDSEGYYYLGLLDHLNGEIKSSISNYKKSLELGSASGSYELGLILSQGDGVKVDMESAYNYMLRAEKHGNVFALKARANILFKDRLGKGLLYRAYGLFLFIKLIFMLPYYALKDPFHYDGI